MNELQEANNDVCGRSAAAPCEWRDRPILFSGAMVRAILEGRKTQTRRGVKPQPVSPRSDGFWSCRKSICGESFLRKEPQTPLGPCPYGQPGDRLWVRETWRTDIAYDDAKPSRMVRHPVEYAAGCSDWQCEPQEQAKWRPSIFMPRWASRLTMEITAVRVERLQEISEADAMAEGIESRQYWPAPARGHCGGVMQEMPRTGYHSPAEIISYPKSHPSAALAYRRLWQSINGHGSWDANPWVWVVEFRKLS